MPSPKKRKARTPEQIMAERIAARRATFEAVELQTEAATLKTFEAVQITRAGERRRERTADKNSVRRLDAFDALREGMAPGAYDAARRLERDITVSRGEHDHGRPIERVDCERDTERLDDMIAASRRVEAVLGRMGKRQAWMLVELVSPSPAVALTCQTWRQVVAHITGEENAHAQAAVVRFACVNLRDAYDGVKRAA
jgi:hypothetical protein